MFPFGKRTSWTFLSGAAGLLISVVFLIGLPAAVYAGNPDEFSLSYSEFVRLSLYLVAIPPVICIVPALVLPERAAAAWASAWAALAFYAWFYGNFVVYDLGTLDGQTWSLKMPRWISWAELAGCLLLVGLIFAAARAKPRPIAALLILLTLGSAASAGSALSGGGQPGPGKTDEAGVGDLFRFSKAKNVLVVLLDAMQSDIFEEVVNENPHIKQGLKGFTFFPDTAGVAPTTFLSIPAIQSGLEYDPSLSMPEYYEAGVRKGSFLNDLARNGYKTALVNPIRGVCPAEVALCTSATKVLAGSQASRLEEAAQLLDIALLRLTPLLLKPAVYNKGKWRISLLVRDERLAHPATKSNALLSELAGKLDGASDRPTAKFLHLFSTHLPVVMNEGCHYVGEAIPKSRASYKVQVRCGLEAFLKVLAALERNGLYDRTAIALLADHGTNGMKNARAVPSDAGMNNALMIGIANPTFAFKPLGASQPFQATPSSISIADITRVVCDDVKDCMRPARAAGRERTFNYYLWKGEYWYLPRIPNIVPYEITGGPMWAGSTWKKRDAE